MNDPTGYERYGSFVWYVGWFLLFLSSYMLFTPDERRETYQLLNDALDAYNEKRQKIRNSVLKKASHETNQV